ncbi:putative protein phosphatase 2C 8 [Citrus sinensis]|uniref:Uncharacterized protein n=1 Tax=Citrus sinensis TaxID=2711 RepID=A0ACB8NWB7_CITSI|nr:putative protein phosphatase 2C 8 [Citrus sinensis]
MSESETQEQQQKPKREGDFDDFNLIAKKSKIEKVNENEEEAARAQIMHKQIDFVEIEADAAEDKGSRHTMEDASVVLVDASSDSPPNLRCAHFAIFDGHGGRLAAEYAQKRLHANVISAGLPRELVFGKRMNLFFKKVFRILENNESLLVAGFTLLLGGWQDGATAVCIWILGRTVFVANIGDAKAVVARSSIVDGSNNHLDELSSLKAIVVTRVHKAIYPQERARIQKSGGTVSSNGRLQGRLEVSRAFGDRQFKKFGVVATPDIHSFEVTERDHFIILGCDGLWGVFGPSDAVEFVQKLLKVTAHFAFTCQSEKLVDFFMELIILSGWFPLRLSSL